MSNIPRRPRRVALRTGWRAAAFAALDFETTGLDAARDDVVSFGVVPITGARIGSGASTYREVAPSSTLRPTSIVVHGLRPADLAEAPSMDVVRSELDAALADRVIVAWVAAVEAAFLSRVFGRSPRWWRRGIVDVRPLTRLVPDPDTGGRPDGTLSSVARRFGVPVERPHHALDDALTTAQLLLVLMPRLERMGIRTPRQLLRAGRD
jgi:DNA polymerase-3 subunit epsilon